MRSFAENWIATYSKVIYDWKASTFTLRDGEKEEAVTDFIFSLPKPEKNGYTFLGWQYEDGNFAEWLFVTEKDIVLHAVYEKKTPEDGRSVNTAAIIGLGETREFYGVNDTSFYFRVDTEVPVQIIMETQLDQDFVCDSLHRQNQAGEFFREYSDCFSYTPGEILKITLYSGLNSYVVQLKVKILST